MVAGLAGSSRASIGADLLAGITLAAIAIPESMGYTKIAGMPVITGIYTLALPVIAFALIGSSRHLVVGADSATAAILFASLASLAAPASPAYVGLAGVVALMTAGFLIVARLLRLGFLADFLSRTALVGFLTGVGVQVALTQLPDMLGIRAHGSVIDQLRTVATSLGQTVPATAVLAGCGVAVILAVEKLSPRLPITLIVVATSTVVAALLRLDEHGVAIVGAVPGGLPPFGLPQAAWGEVPQLAGVAASIFVVVLAQSAATARSFAQKHDEELNENRDLLGLAGANLAAGFTGTFVVNGSLTKTAVVDAAGQHTQLAQLLTAVVTIAVLLVATGLLHYLPDATLAAVVFVIGVHLVDVRHLRDLWRLRRDELAVAGVTALAVVVLGVEPGIIVAVLLSVLDFVRRAYRPRDSVIVAFGTSGETLIPRPAQPGMETRPGGIAYRFDSTLFFANADRFRTRVLALVGAAPHPVRWMVWDLSPFADIDYTGGQVLLTLLRDLERRRIRVHLAHGEDIRDLLERYGIADLVGAACIHHGVREAVAAASSEPELGAGSGPPPSNGPSGASATA
jgi:SulP family sulfate permease